MPHFCPRERPATLRTMARDDRWEQAPDEALVAQYQGDPEGAEGRRALEALAGRWHDRVEGWALRFVRDRDAARDLAQDCLLRMIEGLPRYRPYGRFGAWLFTIVHNRCRSQARPRSLRHDPEIDADDLPAAAGSPDEEFESRESMRRLLADMDAALAPRERAALWLRAADGMSVEDITRVLRIAEPSGARGLLQTARRKLRARIGRGAGERGGRP